MMIAGGIIGGRPPSVVLVDVLNTGSDTGGTYNFTDRPFGSAHPSRILVAGFVAFHSGASLSVVNACSFGGIAATRVAGNTGSANSSFHIWSAHVPEGETGTVTIARSGNMIGVSLVLWAIYDAKNTSPVGAQYGGGSPASIDVPVTPGAVCVGFARNSSDDEITWSGLVPDEEGQIADTNWHYSGASIAKLSGVSPLTVGAAGGSLVLAAASFR